MSHPGKSVVFTSVRRRIFFAGLSALLVLFACFAASALFPQATNILLDQGDAIVALMSSNGWSPFMVMAVMALALAGQLPFFIARLRRRRAERELAAIFHSSLAGMFLCSGDQVITRANAKAGEIFGWELHELLGKPSSIIHLDEEYYQRFCHEHLERLGSENVLHVEWPFRHKDGHVVWCLISGRALVASDLSKGIVWVHEDITERRRNQERLQESESLTGMLFRISNAMQHTNTLEDLFEHVHAILHEVLGAPNFYAGLLDEANDRIVFPYFADERDRIYTIENISDPAKETLTLHVIRSAERLVVRRDQLLDLRSQRRFQSIGSISAIWVGVPLMVRGRVIGAMAVQDYDDSERFSESDVRLLEAAADHISMALERKQAGDALRRSEAKFRTLFENMRDGIVRVDLDGRIKECNPAFLSLLGYRQEELVCLTDQDITPPEWHAAEAELLETQVLRNGYSDVYEKEYVTCGGKFVPVELRTHLATDDGGKPSEIWATVRDVTERKRMEDELKRQALHDPLTGLANRSLCLDRLRFCLERARRRVNYYYAVIFVDLDRFKAINDSMGHAYGDSLLVEVGKRLTDCVRELDTVSRYGGDEFVVLLEELDSPRKAIKVVKRMRREIRKPFNFGDKEANVTASVGIVLGPMEYGNPEDVLQNSNIALHRAKEKGRDRFKVFTEKLLERTVHLLTLENDLVTALGTGQFAVHFQPIVNLQNGGGLYGFEALARWNHPDRGCIRPEQFIAVAEESGAIHDLGQWVLHEACTIMVRWRERHPEAEHLMLAVNISGRQFSHMNLVPKVRRILEKTGMPANRLKLEITETAIMDNAVQVADRLRQLKALGITLSIDDFGTGYSSMSYLQRLPVDNLKIDLSFVRRMDQVQEDVEIVRAIISLAHSLGMCVVAEGVECVAHQEILAELGCEYGQGYLYSRPVAEAEAGEYLQRQALKLLEL